MIRLGPHEEKLRMRLDAEHKLAWTSTDVPSLTFMYIILRAYNLLVALAPWGSGRGRSNNTGVSRPVATVVV